MRRVEQFCTRALYLEKGKIIAENSVCEITKMYMAEINQRSAQFAKTSGSHREGTHEICFTDNMSVKGVQSGLNRLSHLGEDLFVEAEFECYKPMKNIRFRVGIEDLSSGSLITAANCYVPYVSRGGTIRCEFKHLTLRPHAYTILIAITDLKQVIDLWAHAMALTVEGGFSTEVQYSITDRDLIYLPHEIFVIVGEKQYQHDYDQWSKSKNSL